MRVHHRIPSIFNLSMVDVLCCALGCVILLWLLNLRQAKEHEDSARAMARTGAAALTTAENERDAAKKALRDKQAELALLDEQRTSMKSQFAAQDAKLRKLDEDLKSSMQRLETLQSGKSAAEKRAKKLQTVVDTVPGLQAQLSEAREKVASEEALAAALEKEVGKRRLQLEDAAKTMQVMRAARQALERNLRAKDNDLG
ncbi:MAG: hypothetical protein ACRD36_08105, partial [Candidatus Acidiferrum sp.]